MTIDEMIAVLQAAKAGKAIQCKGKRDKEWSDITPFENATWDFNLADYRVKPEPREWWLHSYAGKSSPRPFGALYFTKEDAYSASNGNADEIIKVREVLP